MDNKIDEIFSKKLGSYSKEPSTRTWDKLKSELDKKQEKKAVWYYYVAASLVLLLVGYISFPYLFNKNVEMVATEHNKNLKKLSPKPLQEINPSQSANQNLAIAPLKDIKKNAFSTHLIKKKLPTNRLVNNTHKSDIKEINPLQRDREDKIEELETLALNEHNKNSLASADITSEAEILEPVTIVIKRSNISVAQQEDTTEKASFRNRLGKVYTQVMNLKNGEKVELEELGIKSNLLAFNKRDKQTQDK